MFLPSTFLGITSSIIPRSKGSLFSSKSLRSAILSSAETKLTSSRLDTLNIIILILETSYNTLIQTKFLLLCIEGHRFCFCKRTKRERTTFFVNGGVVQKLNDRFWLYFSKLQIVVYTWELLFFLIYLEIFAAQPLSASPKIKNKIIFFLPHFENLFSSKS